MHSSFYILSALAFPGNRTHDNYLKVLVVVVVVIIIIIIIIIKKMTVLLAIVVEKPITKKCIIIKINII